MPYNPCLLRTFDCHINVEAYGSIKSVKYLFKYIYKGHDRASVVMREIDKADEKGNIDEIKQYRDARWVTPPEALWRCGGKAPGTHKTRHGPHHQRWPIPQDQGMHDATRRAPQAIV